MSNSPASSNPVEPVTRFRNATNAQTASRLAAVARSGRENVSLEQGWGVRSTDGINRDANTDTVLHHIFETLVAFRDDLTIGPLLSGASGSHYNGILSQATFDLTGAAVSVEAVTAPSAETRADLMFTLTVDNQHHYRIFVEEGFVRFERKTQQWGKESAGAPLAFDLTLTRVELKAGTWLAETIEPGSVQFDSVKVVR